MDGLVEFTGGRVRGTGEVSCHQRGRETSFGCFITFHNIDPPPASRFRGSRKWYDAPVEQKDRPCSTADRFQKLDAHVP